MVCVQGMKRVVEMRIQKEVLEDRVLGPFPVPNFQMFPLGMVPKKTAGEYCLIHHLCHPEGDLVNDWISQELATSGTCPLVLGSSFDN